MGGLAWMFLGVANGASLLYDEEFQIYKSQYPDRVRLDYALSRESTNSKGGKMYIQDNMAESAEEIFTALDNGAHIYFCGLKGMMPGIQDMLETTCKAKGIDYDACLKGLRAKNQWHVDCTRGTFKCTRGTFKCTRGTFKCTDRAWISREHIFS